MTRPIIAAFLLAVDPDGRWLVIRDDASPKGYRLPGGTVAADEFPKAVAARRATRQTGMPLTAGPVIFLRWLPGVDCLIHIYRSTIPSIARRTDGAFGHDGDPSNNNLVIDPAEASRFLHPVISHQLLLLHFSGLPSGVPDRPAPAALHDIPLSFPGGPIDRARFLNPPPGTQRLPWPNQSA